MSLKIAVLIKQVPDTAAVTPKAMKADGTLNRSALPAVFNPEDLNALEMALQIKDKYSGSVTAVTMGPPAAAEILRDALYRGADRVFLLTDRKFAASDTLATSNVLSRAIEMLGPFDIVICGTQAIDGNTAQVGPQVAEKLNINQITCVEEIEEIVSGKVRAKRVIEDGKERVVSSLPVLLTATGSANVPRPWSVKNIMKYKTAVTKQEVPEEADLDSLKQKGLLIETLNCEKIGLDSSFCGISGSPTMVKKIENVVRKGKEHKKVELTDEGITGLLTELIADYTFD